MNLKENSKKVEELVYRLAKTSGAEIIDAYCFGGNEEHPDSFSMYFVLRFGLAVKKIRISNHTEQHKSVANQNLLKSITVGEKTNFKDVEKFISRRIKEVKYGALFAAFDYINKCA